jgi:hypothetical protein
VGTGNDDITAAKIGNGNGEVIPDAIKARWPVFLANRWRDLVTMQAALRSGDFVSIRTIAHNCKGIGAGYGFPEISRIGGEIGSGVKALDSARVQESLGDFECCLRDANLTSKTTCPTEADFR